MKRPVAEEATTTAQSLLRQGLALALHDVGQGRAELLAAAVALKAQGDDAGRLLAAATLVVFIGIADENYAGFEEAAATVMALHAHAHAHAHARRVS